MRRAILVTLAVVAFCFAMTAASGAWGVTIAEPPYTTAESCLACHAVANDGPVVNHVDFEVPTVDRTACNKCHWLSSHPAHGAGDDCAQCHTSWPTTGLSLPWSSTVQTAYGWFNSVSSATTTDVAYLHQVHSRRGWAADVTSRRWGCGSCHAPAACTACHVNVPHDSHPLQNGNPAPDAPYAATASGAPIDANSFPALDTFGFVSCAAADCHQGIGTERIKEDSDPSVVPSAGWTSVTAAATGLKLIGSTALYTNTPGSSITVPFTGNQVSVWGYTGYNAGAAQFYIDGRYITTKDFYESGIKAGNGIWMSPGSLGLAAGEHTLKVVAVAGANGGTVMYFDRIVSRDLVAPTNTTPNCLTCHPEREAEHGYDAFDHVADETATIDPALGGKACGDCHSMDLSTAHASVGKCEVCHVPRSSGTTLTAEGTINPDHTPGRWDQTCEACHNAANPVLGADKHAAIVRHDVSAVANDQACVKCHTGQLPDIHASALTATGIGGCDVCHKNPDVSAPLTNDCTVCHFSLESHPNANHESNYGMPTCASTGCHTSVTVLSSTETTEDLVAVHGEFRTFDCLECHGSTSERVKTAIASHNKACDACHDAPGDHRAAHPATPALVDADGPHYAYVTGSAPGGVYTEDCALCHTSNLVDEHLGGNGRAPRYRADGSALGCADCHASTDLKVVTAIANGSKPMQDFAACDDCHVAAGGTPIHDQMSLVHRSGFLGESGEGTADLTAVHANGMTVTPPGGTTLTGCALCHSYFTKYDTAEDAMGTRTQTAIAAPDPACGACHTSAMMAGKHATPDSAACTKCHTKPITELHAASSLGGCAVCHANTLDPDKVTGMTDSDCAQSGCHTAEGVDYHTQMDAKHASPTNVTCFGAGCHDASRDLRLVHADYVGAGAEFSQFDTACDLCHGPDSRIDWTKTVTAGCVDTCHTSNHTQMAVKHATTSASDACTSCHGTDIVRTHGAYADLSKCGRCHDDKTNWSKTIDCATCHAPKFPPATNHYSDTTHTATPFTAAYQGTTVQAGGEECAKCHSAVLPAAHATTSVSGGTVTCVECHTDTTLGSTTVAAASWPTKTCVACHDYSGAASKTHATYGTAHVVAANGCAGTGTGCHASTDLTVLHAKSQSGGAPKYASCYNADPNDPTACHSVKDTRPKAFDPANSCGTGSSGCHQDKGAATHGAHTLNVGGSDYDNATVAGCTNSGAGCHGTETRVPASYENPYHPDNGCATSACHTSASFATHDNPLTCQDCHDGTYTGAPSVKTITALASAGGHYSETTHTATAVLAGTVSSGGTVSAKCTDCHANAPATGLKQLYAQHQGLAAPYGSTTCADCHDYSAGVSAVVKASWPEKTCAACHNTSAMPGLAQHGTTAPVVTATSADGCTACHASDLHALHKGKTGGKVTTCALSGCHDYTKQGLKPTGTTCGTGGACHNTGDPHTPHLAVASSSCTGAGCHNNDAMVVHAARPEGKCAVCHANPTKGDLTAGKTSFECAQSGCHADQTGDHHVMHDAQAQIDSGCAGCHFTNLIDEHQALGYTCATCHASTNTAVKAAIAASSLACSGCHPSVNGKDRHAGQNGNEFVTENSSMHRVDATLSGSKTSFLVNGATYSWTLPSNFLKTGWTTSSVVTCDDCHSFGSAPAGPHGSSVSVNMDPSYTADWQQAMLAPRTTSGIPAGLICDKCHNLNSGSSYANTPHQEHNDRGMTEGQRCVSCHTQLPHGWRLPRLLAYTTDPAPYNTVAGGLQRIRVKNYTPSGWNKSDCYAACANDHGTQPSPFWPSTANTVGTLSGTVSDGSTALAGVTVTTDQGQTATTDATGKYTFAGIPTGTYSVTAAKTGYVAKTAAATVTKNQTTTLDFALEQAPTTTNVALNKTATATSQYSSTYTAAKAVDGLTSTYWRSSTSGNQNLTVDLGGVFDITKAVVNWYGGYYARAYTIQVSTDNSSWTTVANVTSNSSGTDSHDFTARARYIRLACTSANYSDYRVYEFEAWGNPVPTGTISGKVTSGATGLSGATVSGDGLTATTDSNGDYTITGVLEGTYNLTASKTGYVTSASQAVAVTGNHTSNADFSLVAEQVSSNVARNGSWSASSQYSSSYDASHAFDGSYSTFWQSHSVSYSNASEYLQVDLGSAKAIGKVVVGWNGSSYYARSYQVQYASSSSGPWTTIPNGSVSNSTSSSNRTFALSTPITARYWRVNCTSYNSSSGYRLYEFETWTP